MILMTRTTTKTCLKPSEACKQRGPLAYIIYHSYMTLWTIVDKTDQLTDPLTLG